MKRLNILQALKLNFNTKDFFKKHFMKNIRKDDVKLILFCLETQHTADFFVFNQ